MGLRTLIIYDKVTNEAFMNTLVSRYKYLRLLQLSNYGDESLPSSIGKLKHLRYLGLEYSEKLKRLPNSVCKLQNLQTLSLMLVILPHWLQGSMNTLHVLIISDCKNLKELPEWLPTLTCLKRLGISYCPNLLSLPDNMHHLTNLENLKIIGCPGLYKRYQTMIGQDWNKISHIRTVAIEIEE
ncbi:hypothetical protein VNO78_21318 [Psophocarpus tetragonolobus]|uniref:Disease resistance R13L4/SHOC-2-like LRR domain-containing protein n=1 Tax=Psophocarpus tetragonolobus TaxID=3891 RepID=A0AAN9SF18_PSOTE